MARKPGGQKLIGSETDTGEVDDSSTPKRTPRQEAMATADNFQLFGNSENKLELPLLCGIRLTSEELISLASKGNEFITNWKSAAGNTAATFDAMPELNAEQFATFYTVIYHCLYYSLIQRIPLFCLDLLSLRKLKELLIDF